MCSTWEVNGDLGKVKQHRQETAFNLAQRNNTSHVKEIGGDLIFTQMSSQNVPIRLGPVRKDIIMGPGVDTRWNPCWNEAHSLVTTHQNDVDLNGMTPQECIEVQ